jgi:hypothetical protein
MRPAEATGEGGEGQGRVRCLACRACSGRRIVGGWMRKGGGAGGG